MCSSTKPLTDPGAQAASSIRSGLPPADAIAPASLGPPQPPTFRAALQAIIAGANADDLSQFAAAYKAIEPLNVGPKTMIVRDEHHLAGALRRGEDPLDTARIEGERALT